MGGTVGVVGVGGGQRGGCLSEEEASSFVRGVLTHPHLQEVETHLDSCGRCLEYVAALAQSMTSQPSYVTDSRTTEQDATPVERPALARPSAPVEAAMFRGTERFRVLRRLGAGGMGVVYEAYDREHGTRIAIKVLPALAPDGLLRFKNEF